MNYLANINRYNEMPYRRLGKSGLKLPVMSLGLWHNFGSESSYENSREMILGSFDRGITHFDIANNYGPPAGSAEETFGKILCNDLKSHRDELIVSTKAGYHMWEGPYGEWGSRKQLISSLDQSLSRMKLNYVDIFYSHRFDTDTPLEETMGALVDIVKSGKALYVGISNYDVESTRNAVEILAKSNVHCLIHQVKYSMLNRTNEDIFKTLDDLGIGSIAFSSLAQGILTGKYNNGIPKGSRADSSSVFLQKNNITESDIEKAKKLSVIAEKRGQNLSQMALAWVLREGAATSVVLGASRFAQIEDNLKAIDNISFSNEEISSIDEILK